MYAVTKGMMAAQYEQRDRTTQNKLGQYDINCHLDNTTIYNL